MNNSKKEYVIDPEPMLSAQHAILLLMSVFLLSSVVVMLLVDVYTIHILSIIVEFGLYCLPVFIIALLLKYPLNDLVRVRNFFRIDLILITIISTVIVIILSVKIIELIQWLIPYSQDQIDWRKNLLGSGSESPFWLVFMTVAVLPGICEEVLFRGLIQPAFMKKLGKHAGIILTSILFAAIHVSLQNFIPLFLLGLFLGVLSYRTGSFLFAAVAHIIVNGLAVIAAAFSNGQPSANQPASLDNVFIIATAVLFIIMMLLLFKLTPKRAIGQPDMYYI